MKQRSDDSRDERHKETKIRGRCSTFLLDEAALGWRREWASSCFAFMPNESVSQWPRPPQGERACVRVSAYVRVSASTETYAYGVCFLLSLFFLPPQRRETDSLGRIYVRDDNGTWWISRRGISKDTCMRGICFFENNAIIIFPYFYLYLFSVSRLNLLDKIPFHANIRYEERKESTNLTKSFYCFYYLVNWIF